jgi:hypothetical protein
MTVTPHITRPSAESLREFAARRRKHADWLQLEINKLRKQARGLRQTGKSFQAMNLEKIANKHERNRISALQAALSAEEKADRLEGVGEFDLKEAAQ